MTAIWRGAAPLLLASKSAARRDLLAAAGIPFEIRDAMIDERAIAVPLLRAGTAGGAVALDLAREKAFAISAKEPSRLVVGADQTLCLNGLLFTKPKTRAAACAQLEALSGATHVLHSALCVARGGKILFETVPTARLTVRVLSSSFIAAYLDAAGDSVLTSVGAYQLEGLGVHLFQRIEGEQSVILGLPLLPLLAFLRSEGFLAG